MEIQFQNKDNWSEIERKFIDKVRETGFIVGARAVCIPETIEALAESVHENPSTFIHSIVEATF